MKRAIWLMVFLGLLAFGEEAGQADRHCGSAPGQPACPPPGSGGGEEEEEENNTNNEGQTSSSCFEDLQNVVCAGRLFNQLYGHLVSQTCDAVVNSAPLVLPLETGDPLSALWAGYPAQDEITVILYPAPGAVACGVSADPTLVDAGLTFDLRPEFQFALLVEVFSKTVNLWIKTSGGEVELDRRHQLVLSNIGATEDGLDCAQAYEYDAVGNRVLALPSSSQAGQDSLGFLGEGFSYSFESPAFARAFFELVGLVCEFAAGGSEGGIESVTIFFGKLAEFELNNVLALSASGILWFQSVLDLVRVSARCLAGSACTDALTLDARANPHWMMSAFFSCAAGMAQAVQGAPADDQDGEDAQTDPPPLYQYAVYEGHESLGVTWPCLEGAALAAAMQTVAIGGDGDIIITGGY